MDEPNRAEAHETEGEWTTLTVENRRLRAQVERLREALSKWLGEATGDVRRSYCTAAERDDPHRVDVVWEYEDPEQFALAVATRELLATVGTEEAAAEVDGGEAAGTDEVDPTLWQVWTAGRPADPLGSVRVFVHVPGLACDLMTPPMAPSESHSVEKAVVAFLRSNRAAPAPDVEPREPTCATCHANDALPGVSYCADCAPASDPRATMTDFGVKGEAPDVEALRGEWLRIAADFARVVDAIVAADVFAHRLIDRAARVSEPSEAQLRAAWNDGRKWGRYTPVSPFGMRDEAFRRFLATLKPEPTSEATDG